MSHTVKAGLTAGALAMIIVLLFGGWTGVLAALIAGTAAAFASADETVHDRGRAMVNGTIAGATAGALILVAQLVNAYILMPLAGQAATIADFPTLQAGLMALVTATLMGAIAGALNVLPPSQRTIAILAMISIFVLTFPFLDQLAQLGWLEKMIRVLIFIVLALGLNIVVGYAGLLDLGYAAFFAIGAYATGLLFSPQLCNQTGINCTLYQQSWAFWLVIWLAAGVAALFGVILGAPTLPLRGDYLAIVTLGFGEIVPIVFRNLTSVTLREPLTLFIATLLARPEMAICLTGCEKAINITGGEAGINPIGRPALPGIGPFQTGQFQPWYYLIIGIVVVSIFLINRMRRSRMGRAWAALREDELAASSMGIDIVNTKLLAFAMGATFSGFGGAFYGSYISAIFPSVFDFSVSVIILCMVILGGLGSIPGVILGGLIIIMSDLIFLPQLATMMKNILNTSVLPNVTNPAVRDFITTSVDPLQWRFFLFGLTLVIMMLVRPEGLIPNTRRRAELHADEEPGTEALSVQEADAATQLQSIDARDVRAQ